jgi:tRNA 2-thiouridine synthesizing protein A
VTDTGAGLAIDATRRQGRLLDARGLMCPMPLIRTRVALAEIPVGDSLTVLATDPTSYLDIRLFCETVGHVLESADEADGVFTYVIRKVDEPESAI